MAFCHIGRTKTICYIFSVCKTTNLCIMCDFLIKWIFLVLHLLANLFYMPGTVPNSPVSLLWISTSNSPSTFPVTRGSPYTQDTNMKSKILLRNIEAWITYSSYLNQILRDMNRMSPDYLDVSMSDCMWQRCFPARIIPNESQQCIKRKKMPWWTLVK